MKTGELLNEGCCLTTCLILELNIPNGLVHMIIWDTLKIRLNNSKTKSMFLDNEGIIHREFVWQGTTVTAAVHQDVLKHWLNRIHRVQQNFHKSKDWFLLHDNHWWQFSAQQQVTVLDHPSILTRYSSCGFSIVKCSWKENGTSWYMPLLQHSKGDSRRLNPSKPALKWDYVEA